MSPPLPYLLSPHSPLSEVSSMMHWHKVASVALAVSLFPTLPVSRSLARGAAPPGAARSRKSKPNLPSSAPCTKSLEAKLASAKEQAKPAAKGEKGKAEKGEHDGKGRHVFGHRGGSRHGFGHRGSHRGPITASAIGAAGEARCTASAIAAPCTAPGATCGARAKRRGPRAKGAERQTGHEGSGGPEGDHARKGSPEGRCGVGPREEARRLQKDLGRSAES